MVTIAAALAILGTLVGPAIAESIVGKISEDSLDFLVKKITGNTPVGQYYKNAVQKIYREKDSDLVGEDALSHNDIYMDAYSTSTDDKFKDKKILSIIQEWSHEDTSGVMLIHGEPGHGKTTLCRKAVYEHVLKQFCPDKTNVFWFRLNPAFAEDIIENGKFVLKNAFRWGNPAGKFGEIPLEENEKEYQNSVIFLDGYDELKAQLHGVNKNLQDFITTAKQMAQDYDMHIVITTRTRSLSDEGRLNIPSFQFAAISKDKQDAWIEKNAPDYKEDFEVLRSSSSEDMKEMLGIPILFRMVVKAKLKSTIAKNVVDLYDTLFAATMERRAVDSAEMSYWREKYERFAYEIYCNDEQFADVEDEQRADEFLYMFHLRGEGKQHVEFIHRSFYQYFLAHFLYRKMSEVEDEASAKAFLCCLAERQIDKDVLEYIQRVQEKEQRVTKEKCKCILNEIDRTDAIIADALSVKNKNGNAEKHQLRRCNNIFVNALSIYRMVAVIKESEFTDSLYSVYEKKNIHRLMQRYDCSGVWLENADLSIAVLNRAELNIAYLKDARLIGAFLNGANLSGADLTRAVLDRANLSNADLSSADLMSAKLKYTDLSGADLRYTKNLNTCNCTLVENWTGCKILLRDKYNLGLDDPAAHGIIWCDNETGKPIEFHGDDVAWYDDDGIPIKS